MNADVSCDGLGSANCAGLPADCADDSRARITPGVKSGAPFEERELSVATVTAIVATAENIYDGYH